MRGGGWVASVLSLNLGLSWIADGTAARIGNLKRENARARQALVAKILANATVQANKRAFHLWLELLDPWRADTLVSAAARLGVAITPASAFAVTPGHAIVPHALVQRIELRLVTADLAPSPPERTEPHGWAASRIGE